MGNPPSLGKDRFEALTGLRFIAAAAVFYHHLAPLPNGPEVLVTAKMSGYWGVTLFFILSGFVLSLNYFDTMTAPTPRKIWSFAVARVARVYPLYLACLLYWTSLSGGIGEPRVWLEHALAVQAWMPDMGEVFRFNGPAWSVGVELFLYATFPLLVPLLARVDRSVRSLLVAGTLIAAALFAVTLWFQWSGRASLPLGDPRGAHRWLYRMPALRLADFGLGIVAARLFLRLRTREGIGHIGRGLTAAGVLGFAVLTTSKSFVYAPFSWDAGYVLPSLALILGLSLAPSTVVARALSTRVMVGAGDASYAFYLAHWGILHFVGTAWAVVQNNATIAITAFHFGAALVLSVGLHVVIEQPARAWLRRHLEALWPVPGGRTARPSLKPVSAGL